ncbi:Long-chain-fatty-acid--CoA ligase [Gryllus bimaculatus]|nr:Long-chain-fatty-acid--CoA ligase [Gryllus bimaculatus]
MRREWAGRREEGGRAGRAEGSQTPQLEGPELVRVSKFYKESKEGKFVSFIDKDVRTLYDSFRQGAKESNNGPCLGWRDAPGRPYQWLSYDEALLRARNFGSGLTGLEMGPGSLIGIYSQNCPEWVLTEQGAYCYSMVLVPLYDTLGPDACAYIIKQADIQVVIVEDDAKANLLLDRAPRSLRRLVSIKETRPATNQRARNRGVEVLRFEDVESAGAARNSPEVVVEGYGQTECCAPISLTVQGDHVPEHVGPPVACCCIKLVDVPEMEYYAINNQGEVCVKGTNVFQGYYKAEDKTKETIDSDGWHHTGDVGMWLPNGTLKIIDRKKHIFKLSQGEYIVPEKIENIYIRSQYVQQVFVVGESLKSCIVAVVVPDVEVVKGWAQENHIPGTLSVLCNNPEVKKLIMDDMLGWGKDASLKSFEQVKDIYLHPDPFSVQNGLLTPTLKSKRPQLKAYFKPQIEDMYAKLT